MEMEVGEDCERLRQRAKKKKKISASSVIESFVFSRALRGVSFILDFVLGTVDAETASREGNGISL